MSGASCPMGKGTVLSDLRMGVNRAIPCSGPFCVNKEKGGGGGGGGGDSMEGVGLSQEVVPLSTFT